MMGRLRASLLLLALSLASSEGDPQKERAPKVLWSRPLLLPSTHAPGSLSAVARAAQTALHYFNYRQGSPTSLRELGQVKKASVKNIPGVGQKYFLQFSTKDFQNWQKLGMCLGSVFYLKKKPKPTVEISCTHSMEPDQRLRDDYSFYLSIRDNNDPTIGHLWALGAVGSSYIAWEKSTEDLSYILTQIKNVKQWRRADDSLEYDYSVLLANDVSKSLSCHMRIIWNLAQPMKVKYVCSTEDESSGFGEGSGAELGSTSGFFIEQESNF